MASVNFADVITFTRASGGGRFNSAGVYEWVGNNVPRLDYDPVTGECRGLLVEESRTNLLTRSSDFANSEWEKGNITVSPNAEVAPDGSASASLLVCPPGTGFKFVRRYWTDDSATKTISFFVKKSSSHAHVMIRGVRAGAAARFNLDTGTVEYIADGVTSASIEAIGGGWWRISASETQTVGSYVGIYPCSASATSEQFTADGTEQVYVWGAQLEVGSFPTSYIPTTTAQVTRAADIASVNELSPWYRTDEYTVYAEVGDGPTGSGKFAHPFSIHDGTNNNAVTLYAYQDTNSIAAINAGGATVAALTGPKLRGASGGLHRVAIRVKANDFAYCVNGASPIVDAIGAMPSATKLTIGGSASGGFWSGHIRSIRYFPRALPNVELQEITA